jgi:hypothetical protein
MLGLIGEIAEAFWSPDCLGGGVFYNLPMPLDETVADGR